VKICFASNNPHKLGEIRDALMGRPINLLSLHDINCFEELPETKQTLEGNALEKAEHVLKNYGIVCFADDTGLEVDALQGAPGVYSARYAGVGKKSDDNIDLLLSNMSNKSNRNAQFRTVIALVGLEQHPVFFEGIVKGRITRERRGSGGFGYDAVFVPMGNSKTFAEMTLPEKNSLSHRAIAVRKLNDYLTSRAD
jgi:XTP/dITP diphosphohydrolase